MHAKKRDADGNILYDEDSVDLGSSIDKICEEASLSASNQKQQHFTMKQLNNDSRGKSPEIQPVKVTDKKTQPSSVSNMGPNNAQLSQGNCKICDFWKNVFSKLSNNPDEESNAKRRKHNESNRSVVEVQIAAFEKQQAKHRVVKEQVLSSSVGQSYVRN